ncbi:MAG: hypothetical protein VXZ18_19410, partial [Pseudomonadota bacterium]|nr:hypothetical protein [Pseudomonadota bacterium]
PAHPTTNDHDAVTLHTTAPSDTRTAATSDDPARHRTTPTHDDEHDRPTPRTVTATDDDDDDDDDDDAHQPRDGHADDARADRAYVNDDDDALNCCAFTDTSARRRPATDRAADPHSTSDPPTHRPTDAPPPPTPSRQRTVDVSRTREPHTHTRVPPSTHPADGDTPLTHTRKCTNTTPH